MSWYDWSQDAFDQAREQHRPVLLFVKASWCRWCRELEEKVLGAERAALLLDERFVCIKVDKDRRPDIDARYSKGGWPTLAWLDDTGELLASDTYLEVEDFLERANMVADYYARNRETIRQRIEEVEAERERQLAADREAKQAAAPTTPGAGAEPTLQLVEDVVRTIKETADPEYGGWGSQQKFPHPEAIDLALVRWSQTGDNSMLTLVVRTLRNMQEGEIHDRVEGGFYRYATRPDWSAPNYEKMLDSNAQRLFCYLEVVQAFGDESFRKTAAGILSWMYDTLHDPATRAFRGSQDANPQYAHLTTLEARRGFGRPACDPTIFTNWNAMAVSALLKAAVVLDEVRHRDQALATLDFLMEELFDSSRGMYHYWDGGYHLPGMLTDQAYTLRALIDAMQYAGENRFLAQAEELARLTIEHLQSPGGGFYDTLYDPQARGGLRHRNRSILDNGVMAEALLRLSRMAHVKDYADTARDTLRAFAADYKRYGHYVAGYARAVDLLIHEPVHVTIVGPRRHPQTRALTDAALRPYVASRVVQTLDAEEDAQLLRRAGLVAGTATEIPRAFVHRGRESYAETSEPERLPALMTKT